MNISKITLQNFRNFKSKRLEFSSGATIIVGPNASGKTNILEALYLLSTGKSFRARVEEEMIKYSSQIARIEGLVDSSLNIGEESLSTKTHILSTKLDVVLTRGEITIGGDPEKIQKAPRKKLMINGIPRRLFNFSGNFKVVLFGPWDLDLVTESPSIRRRFLDSVLSQVDREYARALLSYEKGLRQRNKILWNMRENPSVNLGRSQLLFWDRLLIKNGNYISEKREEFINYINSSDEIDGHKFRLGYDKSAISEGRLEQYKDEEIAAATTLVGPHRDDFIFRLKERESKRVKEFRDLDRFGSRGEQRMGVLWLKLCELSYIESITQEKPTLLLDDIFSELDHEHRKIVFKVVNDQQTIITTADPHYVESLKKVEKIDLGR